MPTCPVSMAYGWGFGFVVLCLLHIAHTQRGPAGHIEFYSDYGRNHDEERVSLASVSQRIVFNKSFMVVN